MTDKVKKNDYKQESSTQCGTLLCSNAVQNTKENICVCIRKKPVKEGRDTMKIEGRNIRVESIKTSLSLDDVVHSHQFTFDRVFDENCSNEEIFRSAVQDMVDFSITGGSGAIIAYGQTGTGKTFTLLDQYTGVLFQILKHSLSTVKSGTLSFLEIYMGNAQDCLMNNKKINLLEKNGEIYVSEITVKAFQSLEVAVEILRDGISNRTTSITDTNATSSRSHAVVIIEFSNGPRVSHIAKGKKLLANHTLAVVDLAGSERGCDRKACSKETASEGAEINKSLLVLKECIRGIEMKNRFLPFRQSKLTQILKNSLIGNSRTCFIANVSASVGDIEHTLNTLRYASRIKEHSVKFIDRNNLGKSIIGSESSEVSIISGDFQSMCSEDLKGSCTDNLAGSESENVPPMDKVSASTNIFQDNRKNANLAFNDILNCDISGLFDNKIGNLKRKTIQASTIAIQKSKIEFIMKGLSDLIEKESNLQVLKNTTVGLEELVAKLNNKFK